MPGPVTREEFDELADEVRGEKVVTRHILEQTRRNSDDLAVLKTRVTRVEEKVDILDRKVDGLDRKVDGLDAKIDRVERKVDSLARDMPRIVADTMREVLREGRAGK
jgi:peptidoglycan hydrolase CwlO-like protein